MSRPSSLKLWLGLSAAGMALAVAAGVLFLGRSPDRGVEALMASLLVTFAAAGWWRAHRHSVRANRLEHTLASVRQSAAIAALRDPLTGLGNNRLFDTCLRMASARAQRYTQSFSILLIEVNLPETKRVGTRPSSDDRVMKYVATIVATHLRAADLSARIADTMFGVVLYETDYDGAIAAWNRLRSAAHDNWPESRSWSVSGGAAMYSVDTASVESLVSDADRRLALEKRRLRAEPES